MVILTCSGIGVYGGRGGRERGHGRPLEQEAPPAGVEVGTEEHEDRVAGGVKR